MVNGFQPLTISAKRSILDVWQSSEYVFVGTTLVVRSFKYTIFCGALALQHGSPEIRLLHLIISCILLHIL